MMLRFDNEAQMQTVLQTIPHTPFGSVRVRGSLGVSGQYEETGELDEEGNPVIKEIVAPIVYDGYFVELFVDTVPKELEAFACE